MHRDALLVPDKERKIVIISATLSITVFAKILNMNKYFYQY